MSKSTKLMAFCKALTERIADIKGGSPYSRESQLLSVLDIYSETFNKQKAAMYFADLPEEIIWRGNYTFFVLNEDEKVVFKPETVADFISVCESLGFTLEPNIDLEDEDELTLRLNERLKWTL